MPAKSKASVPQQEIHICYICGREVHGDHVIIKPRGQRERHIHFECMPGKQQVN